MRIKTAIAVVLIASAAACATNHPPKAAEDLPRRQGFVSDFAGKLSPATKATLELELAEFASRSNIDLAVVTIPFDDMRGRPIEEYSLEMGRSWGIGRGPDKLGLLLLIAIKPPDSQGVYRGGTRLEVSRNLEHDISNELAGEIIRAMSNDLISGRFDVAVSEGVDLIISTVSEKRGVPEKKVSNAQLPREEATIG